MAQGNDYPVRLSSLTGTVIEGYAKLAGIKPQEVSAVIDRILQKHLYKMALALDHGPKEVTKGVSVIPKQAS